MLSILIPVYNTDVTELVSEIHLQASAQEFPFEIICLNDASSSTNPLPELSQFKWLENTKNAGRAVSRNRLVSESSYDLLLFLDADMRVATPDFIKRYISASDDAPVVCGGIVYESEQPEDDFRLRWAYGRKAEERSAAQRGEEPYGSFMTGSFMAKRSVLENHKFDFSLVSYGHEDTLLGKDLLEAAVKILHINNPAVHLGLETNKQFIEKTKEGLKSLSELHNSQKITRHYSKVIRLYEKFSLCGMLPVVIGLISLLEKLFCSSLTEKGKHIWLFQLLKLKWFSETKKSTVGV